MYTIPKGLLDPRKPVMQRWDLVIAALLVFTAVVTPFEVAFVETRHFYDPLFIINRSVARPTLRKAALCPEGFHELWRQGSSSGCEGWGLQDRVKHTPIFPPPVNQHDSLCGLQDCGPPVHGRHCDPFQPHVFRP